MGANSEKIVFCIKLPKKLYYEFHYLAQQLGETKASFLRRCLRQEVRKELRGREVPQI